MTPQDGIDFKRRLVMMIATDENHSTRWIFSV